MPNADQYGFKEEKSEDQTSGDKLGAAILREVAGSEEEKESPPESVPSDYSEEEEGSGREKEEAKTTEENCKGL